MEPLSVMRFQRLLRAMFPNWLNIVLFLTAVLFLAAVVRMGFVIGRDNARVMARWRYAHVRGRSAPQLGQNTNAR